MKKMVNGTKSRHVKKPKPVPWWAGGPATAGAVTGLMVVAVLVAIYEPSDRASIARAHAGETLPQSEQPRAGAEAPGVTDRRVAPDATRSAPATSAATAPSETVNPASSVTITGCLERSDEAFRLMDTAGARAPKARNWKSGFLKKSTASVEVVAAANRVNLSNHVGERVSVTGTLVDREMRARSLQRVAASCGGGAKVRT